MKRKTETIPFIVLSLILLLGLFASACSSGNGGAPEGKSLLQDRCTKCHTLSRIEKAEKTRDEWVATVDRMISYGAELNSEERTVLLDYLETNYSK
jgi:hypothetical protein